MRSAPLLSLLLASFLALSLLVPAEAAKHHHKTDEDEDENTPRKAVSHNNNKGDEDDDDEGDKKSSSPAFTLPGANSRGMIAQCQCEELDSCRSKTRKQFRTCKEKCVAKLQHSDWDADEGRRCFAWKEHSRSRQCWEALKKQSCSQDSGEMIPVNQTIQFHHHQHRQQSRHRHALHRDNDDEEEESTPRRSPRKTKVGSGTDDSEFEPAGGSSSAGSGKGAHRHHHHHRHSGFSRMIKKTFGESGTEFLSCVRECFKVQRGKHCTKELKCGLERLPRDDLREDVEKCRETKRKERKEMCDCLEKAGVKKVDCGNNAEDNKLH